MAIPRLHLQWTVLLALVAPALLTFPVSAQQITYYDFNTPQSSGQSSYTCSPTVSASNPLFCFNDATGNSANPSFFLTAYPQIIDPTGGSGGNYYATQMTPATTNQSSSMWFSVPQKVTNGFTAYFAFQLTGGSRADGIAFVIQNALGRGTDSISGCTETSNSSGLTAVATDAQGGCLGYGGIDNSVALEFDTYTDGWDPNNNHIALQSCGLSGSGSNATGLPNSPSHDNATSGGSGCTVQLTNATGNWAYGAAGQGWAISSPSTSTLDLASGVHQVVVIYNGPNDFPANTLTVYIDPAFNPGTHTPVPSAVPVFQGGFNLQNYIVPYNSGTPSNPSLDSAFVGFTAGTGDSDEIQNIMAWTFTPHTTVSQTQPLAPDDTTPGTTDFNFGTHTYAVTYPTDSYTDDTFSMGVIASTISQANFAKVLGYGASQYNGSQCQVYDDTGGNCIIYSEFCYQGSPSNVVACPKPKTSDGNPPTDCLSDPGAADCVGLLAAYNNSVQPTSPGYLQGDPLYSPITSIVGNGTTATVTCTGDCSVSDGQTVNILVYGNEGLTEEFSNVSVISPSGTAPNTFTFNSTFSGTDNGGFLTSSNVQDIFTGYTPQNVDGTTAGKTTNLGSDFVVTGTTVAGTQTQLSAPNNDNNAVQNVAEELTATVGPPATAPAGLTLLSIENIPTTPTGTFTSLPGSTISGSVAFSDSNSSNGYVSTPINGCESVPLTAVTVNNVTTYQAQCNYTPPVTGTDTITAQYSDNPNSPYHQQSQTTLVLNVGPQTVQVTIGTSPAGLTFEVVGPNVLSSGTYNTTQTPNWNVDTNYTLIAPSPQTLASTPNTQYVFSQWSDGGSATDIVTASATTTSYTAVFNPQYQLTATASPAIGGSVSVSPSAPNNYYAAQSTPTITATANPGYVFSGWTGPVASSTSASTTVAMNAPETVIASFTAVPMIGISPPSINLGTLYLGSIVTKTVQITNTGAAPMTISDPRIAILPGNVIGNLSEFITLNLCPKTLAAGKSCVMTVTFIAGPFYGQQNAALTITDSAAGSPQTVQLTANVINPQASLSPSSLSFGTVSTGTATASKSVTLSNPGGTTLSITGIALSGTDQGDYSITSDTCVSSYAYSLPAGKNCTIAISFKPLAKGSLPASLVVTDNAKSGSQSVSLMGTGK